MQYSLVGYADMLSDTGRVTAHAEALRRHASGRTVLDLGAGFGFFSLLALQSGARRCTRSSLRTRLLCFQRSRLRTGSKVEWCPIARSHPKSCFRSGWRSSCGYSRPFADVRAQPQDLDRRARALHGSRGTAAAKARRSDARAGRRRGAIRAATPPVDCVSGRPSAREGRRPARQQSGSCSDPRRHAAFGTRILGDHRLPHAELAGRFGGGHIRGRPIGHVARLRALVRCGNR